MSSANQSEGVVVRVEPGLAWVRMDARPHACGSCERKTGCSMAEAGPLLSSETAGQTLCLPNSIEARLGDRVVVELAGGRVWQAAWHAYGLPLLLALAASILLQYLTGNELLALGGVLLGLAAGFVLLKGRGLDMGGNSPILTLKFKTQVPHFIARS